MRHYRALVQSMLTGTVAAFLLGLLAAPSHAQVVFDGTDWTIDRGGVNFHPIGKNQLPDRPGRIDIGTPGAINAKTDSGLASTRWVWPRTDDLSGNGTALPGAQYVVDNPFAGRPKANEANSTQPTDALNPWTANPVSGNIFQIPVPANRTVNGGFSFNFDPSDPADFDYGYTPAIHNDFLVNRGAGNASTPASQSELFTLPNVAPAVYASVQNVLVNQNLSGPVAQWTIGTQGNSNSGVGPVPFGPTVNYSIDIYSPGSGTVIPVGGNTILHPNVQRAFVRVSWKNTVPAAGTINYGTGVAGSGGVNDPTNSRIFLVDLSQSGWISLSAPGALPAIFPNAGGVDQLTVTLYSVTPDDPNDLNLYGSTALVTADAVRFTQQQVSSVGSQLGTLGNITPTGVVNSPVVGTNKFDAQGRTVWYVARQELTQDPTPRSYVDPTDPNSTPIPDPTATATVPVFYCLNNLDETAGTSIDRVIWRYVGYPEEGTGSTFASPVIANVRARDGTYHSMVYFVSFSNENPQSGGHIYALDAIGDPANKVTKAFWTYPSVRPLTQGEVNAQKYPAQYHDPNYANSTPGPYPNQTQWWAPDLTLQGGSKEYYDGDIAQDGAGNYLVKSDTQITFGGMSASPVVIDDPSNKAGQQVLIVPSLSGRIFAFDAGGRGDFTTINGNAIPGTTQRFWTWPHFSADAYHALKSVVQHPYLGGDVALPVLPDNTYAGEPAVGAMYFTPSYDPTYPYNETDPNAVIIGPKRNPIIVSSADGHIYAVIPLHDTVSPAVGSNNKPQWQERRLWIYPRVSTSLTNAGEPALLDAPGVPTIYTPASGPKRILFTSNGRIYSILYPDLGQTQQPQLPLTLYQHQWTFPSTPNAPYPDPNDPTTIEYQQGFSAKGVAVIPGSVSTVTIGGNLTDMCYALTSDGTIVGVRADTGAYYASTPILTGQFSDSAPTLVRLQPDPAFYEPARTLVNIPSVPTLLFTDDLGEIFGVGLVSEDNGGGTQILPLLYARFTNSSAPLNIAPVLVGQMDAGAFTQGGYFVVSDTNNPGQFNGGQVYAFAVRGNNGLTGDTTSGSDIGNGSNGAQGDLSIDIRAFDAYTKAAWDGMTAQSSSGTAFSATPAHNQAGGNYPKTATPLPTNIGDTATNGLGVDQGGNLYVAMSGVYHAQPRPTPMLPTGGTNAPTIHLDIRVTQYGVALPAIGVDCIPTTMVGPDLWPDDLAVPQGTPGHDDIAIYGNAYTDTNNTTTPTYGLLTGKAQNVYPWVAKTTVPFIPQYLGNVAAFSPNSAGIRITVTATIRQTIQKGASTTQQQAITRFPLLLGSRDDLGRSRAGGFIGSPNNVNERTDSRPVYITNPLSITTGGFRNLHDETGNSQINNMIGWAGGIDDPSFPINGNVKEILGNNNFVGLQIPAGPGTAAISNGRNKALFAPIDLTQDNASVTYQGATLAGARQNALFVMDRSAIFAATNQPVRIHATVTPFTWNGSATSVLNPLPWEDLPGRGVQSRDYPGLDPRGTHLTLNGGDLTRGVQPLPPPTLRVSNDARQRDPSPTPLTLTVQVPKYQPASLNRGQISATVPNGTAGGRTVNFGAPFTDVSGQTHGVQTPAAGYQSADAIVGPLNLANGQVLNGPTLTSNLTVNNQVSNYPAGGYISSITITTVPPGNPRPSVFPPRNTQSGTVAARSFQSGVCVAPSFRLKVQETTLDAGSLPIGTGYSDFNAATGFYRYPFAPNATGPYQPIVNFAGGSIANTLSPWDDETLPTSLGKFFLPFTLTSDGNVNLVSPRLGKMAGPYSGILGGGNAYSDVINNASLSLNPNPTSVAAAARLNSEQVNSLLSPPLIAAPFGKNAPTYLGNIGVVSSLDHFSFSQGQTGEFNLYQIFNGAGVATGQGIVNPAMDANAVTQAQNLNAAGLYIPYVSNANTFAQFLQIDPSVHKPLVGDGGPVTATVPDQPHDFATALLSGYGTIPLSTYVANGLFDRPKVGVAIPIGTPSGTYSSPLFPYEDGLPVQWTEYLSRVNPNSSNQGNVIGNNDNILNAVNGHFTEPYANPTFTLKVNVREARLTEGITKGTLAHIDGTNNPVGFNVQPTAVMIPGANLLNRIFLYWTTNRQTIPIGNSGKYIFGSGPNPGAPLANAPLNIAYTALNSPYLNLNGFIRGDAQFGFPFSNATGDAHWWSVNDRNNTLTPYTLLPGFDNAGNPLNVATHFPSTSVNGNSFVAGTPNPQTVAYGSPSTALATLYNVTNDVFATNPPDNEAYLVMQGQIDKLKGTATGAPVAQQTESRTFIASLNRNGHLGEPDFTLANTTDGLKSFLNDPALPKFSPKPLLVKLETGNPGSGVGVKYLYVFWHSGAQGRTSLYYNVNVQANGLSQKFDDDAGGATPAGFSVLGDQKLPVPGALLWQSDPQPAFRRVFDPITNAMVNAVDIVYTGVLKNRQTVEVLLSRYRIVESPQTLPNGQTVQRGQLVPIPLPEVHQETLTRSGSTNTYAARDASWFLPDSNQNKDLPTSRFMRIYLQRNGNLYLLNGRDANGGTQRGRIDTASGLVYFDAIATVGGNLAKDPATLRPVFGGGQFVVDPRSGTVSFPSIAPARGDAVLASYLPYVMRLNTSRDESNIDRDGTDFGVASTYGNLNASYFPTRPMLVSSGNNYSPTLVMDRGQNVRALYTSPRVIFTNGNVATNVVPPIDRMWVLYRKTDLSAKAPQGAIYMKTMRLMARLPRPVALSGNNGVQAITKVTVTGARKGYEVDYARGRIYFQEEDEGNIVKVNYTYYDPVSNTVGGSGDLYYRVAWGDEMTAGTDPVSSNLVDPDPSIHETQMRTSGGVNEGSLAAFKDPYIDKLWIFWSSTRANTTDLFYQTLAPEFYPFVSSQY